jgi:hypothetical protein
MSGIDGSIVKSDRIGAVGTERARRSGRSQMILIIHFRASMAPEQCQLSIYLADFARARRRLREWLRFVNDCTNASKRIVARHRQRN